MGNSDSDCMGPVVNLGMHNSLIGISAIAIVECNGRILLGQFADDLLSLGTTH